VIFLAATAIVTPLSKHVTTPKPTPIPRELALRPGSIDLTFPVDVQGLLADSPMAAQQVKQQVSGLLQQNHATGYRAGIVLIFSGGIDTGLDTAISEKVHTALVSLGDSKHLVFNHKTVFRDFIDQGESQGMVTLNIYVFD
ncbi:MAG: hypothetical protein JO215_14090, partial [Ktedonobacteraceae bacterium]|nr:hypothetical protein [Ktedonobacteraceae bacterium]